MTEKKLFDIQLPTETREEVLEHIIKFIQKPKNFHMIMSLNPEIFVEMDKNPHFKKAVAWGQAKIIDGTGVVLAARLLGVQHGPRYTGVDLMEDLISEASKRRLTVVLLGGKQKVAERLADCYSEQDSNLKIYGFEGFKDIQNPTQAEEDAIFSIVADRKPHILLLAYGSPAQEIWLYENREKLKGIVCAGVGGSFDFHVGDVRRAPRFIRKLGLEWMYRLLQQPWRWKRQLKLLTFGKMVLKEKLHQLLGSKRT